MALIARYGDSSTHGGTIITCAAVTKVEGQLAARVGDLHSCPIPGHGVTPIVNGSGNFLIEGSVAAVYGSSTACGAIIIPGDAASFATLESPGNAGTLGGPAVLGGPDIPANESIIMG